MIKNKGKQKVLALFLVGVMLISSLWHPQMEVFANKKDTTYTNEVKESTSVKNAQENETSIQKTENATIYKDGTGKNTAEIYAQDIRFKDEKGKLTDYDTSLQKVKDTKSTTGEDVTDYDYQTTATDKMSYFPDKVNSKTPILSECEQYAVKINPKETLQQATLKREEKETTQVEYAAKNNAIDYQYESTTNGLKESIILDKKTNKNTFEFDVTLKNCIFVSQEDLKKEFKTAPQHLKTTHGEDVFLYDMDEDQLTGKLPAAFMLDANGAYSEECTYDITMIQKKDGMNQYRLTLKVSQKYLEEKDRAYPVTIDPTVTWNTSDARKVSSAYVCSTAPNSNYTDKNTNILCVGKRDTAKDLCRAYLKFEGVDGLLAGMYVENATMELNFQQVNAGMKMYVRQVTSGWGASEITYNNQPKREETLAEITTTTNMSKATINLDAELIDSRARDEGRMSGYEITTSKNDSDTSSSKTAWIYNSVSVNGTKIPKLTITYYDKSQYTDCPHIKYKVYDEGKRWSVEGEDGGFAGDNEGEDAMAARAFHASVVANGYNVPGVKYRAYYNETGWSAWKSNGATAGDTSKTYNMKAIEMQWNTTSAENAYYDLYYRVYVPGRGWLGWAKNAQTAGDYTSGKYISAMEAVVVPKMLYRVDFEKMTTNQKLYWDKVDSGIYKLSCMDDNRIYRIATKFADSNMRSKYSISLNAKLENGTILTTASTDTKGYIGVSSGYVGITQYKAQFSDITLRSRYNIEHTGNVLTSGISEEKWKKNDNWTGNQLNGKTLNSISLRLVPKEYNSGKKACYSEEYLVRENGFSFKNADTELGYQQNTAYDKNKFIDLFGETIGEEVYKNYNKWKGSCYGMALLSQLFYHNKLDSSVFATVIDQDTENVYGLQAPAGKKNKELRDLIDYMHLTQKLVKYNNYDRGKTYKSTENNMMNLVQTLLKNKQNYIMLIFAVGYGHAVVPLKAKSLGDDKYVIDMYDVNEPGKVVTATVDTKNNTFKYGSYSQAGLVDINEITTLYKSQFDEIIKKYQNPSYQINNASYMKDANIILAKNVAASQITNEEGKCIEDIEGVSKVDDFDNPDKLMYYVPEGTYHVDATENKDASITFVDYDASVSYDNLKEGEISANFKKDDSIQSNMKLNNTTDKVEVSTYDKHENENRKICSGKQIKVISEDNHASIKMIK